MDNGGSQRVQDYDSLGTQIGVLHMFNLLDIQAFKSLSTQSQRIFSTLKKISNT
jgi:hypothetical protein